MLRNGHFFAGRFKARAITDPVGTLICGVYVDLNQIRAEEAASIQHSKRTSAYRRLVAMKRRRQKKRGASDLDGFLSPINYKGDDQDEGYRPAGRLDSQRVSDKGVLEMTLEQYFELLDWAGRQSRRDKRGKISDDAPTILEALSLSGESLMEFVEGFEEIFGDAVGSKESMKKFAEQRRRRKRARAKPTKK